MRRWFRHGLEPAIQVFVQSDVRAVRLAAEITLTQHLI